MAVIGVSGGVAQILATQSYRYADASLLASFDYLAMLWALLASLAFFDQWPSPVVFAGAAAITVSGLLAILGERVARRQGGERRFRLPSFCAFPVLCSIFQTKSGIIANGLTLSFLQGQVMGIEGRDKQKALEAGAVAVSGQLGKTVQRLRKAYNLSLSELSEQSGVAKSIISQIERNETNPTLATIWRLAQALDVSIERVLRDR